MARRSEDFVRCTCVVLLLVLLAGPSAPRAWGAQGHRLVALLATSRLKPVAGQNVTWLLAPETLADVSSWADSYQLGNLQTSFWHFLNIPPDATAYDRNRDCPRQPGAVPDSPADRWRDCAVDRILYNKERLGDASLDRADRAVALKFLVHFVGDLHQPFHALGVERGGNGIPVTVFGSERCGEGAAARPCNLHGVWDTALITHRNLDDRAYLAALEDGIRRNGWGRGDPGSPDRWAMESHALAKPALLRPKADVDEKYFRTHIGVIDRRLAEGGVRLAAILNDVLTTPPPR